MEKSTDQRTLVSKVIEGVVTGILGKKYGATLPSQDVLSKEFGVCRPVVREALAVLLARNMIDMRRKIGSRLRPVRDWRMIDEEVVNWRFLRSDPKFLLDAMEVRMLVEPRAAALAATHHSATDIAAIDSAFKAFCSRPPGTPGHTSSDEALQTCIIRASGNQILLQMTPIVRGTLSALVPSEELTPDAWEETVQLHSSLIEAIAMHDAKAAEAASLALIDLAMRQMTGLVCNVG